MTMAGIDPAAATLLAALAESAVRALLLAGVIGGALALFRVRRTAWRLSVWTIVLWAALAMPALGRVLPAWHVPMANLPGLAWLQPPAPSPTTASDLNARLSPSASPVSLVGPRDPKIMIDAAGAATGAPQPAPLRAPRATPQPPRLFAVLLGLYLVGLVTLSVRAAIGWVATRRLERAARPVEHADALARFARIALSSGCRHAPRLTESDRLHVPVTVSVTRPMVILPHTWRAWDGAMLDAVLTHEVAHVARRDALTQRLALLHRATFWFNPLAWWLPGQLADLAEQASDETVLSAGISRTKYARVLLEFFRALPPRGHRADWHVAMARGAAANAEARVDRILSWKGGQAMRLTKSVVLIVVLAATPAVALAASARPSPGAPSQPPAPPTQPAATRVPAPAAAPVPAQAPEPQPSAARPPVRAPGPNPTPRPIVPDAPVSADATIEPASVPLQTPAPLPLQTPSPGMPLPIPDAFGAGAYRPGHGVSWPQVLREAKPVYTEEAHRAGIQGVVELEIVVLADGTVGPVRITKSLDGRSGLDNEAVRSARQWRFKPAQLDGRPVAAVVGLILEYRLHDRSDPPSAGSPARPRPLEDEFARGAYFTFGAGMVAPQPIGQRGDQVTLEATVNRDGTIANVQRIGLVPPRINQQATPKYTPDAMRAKIQGQVDGQVDVEVIVMPDGSVGKARVVRSLDAISGFDEAALVAARQSTFTPGTLDGKRVPVLVTLTFPFRVR